jgi:hypothetical protein
MLAKCGVKNLTGDVSKARSSSGKDWRGRRVEDTYGDGDEWRERQELDWAATSERRSRTSHADREEAICGGRRRPYQPSGACPACGLVLPATRQCDSCAE